MISRISAEEVAAYRFKEFGFSGEDIPSLVHFLPLSHKSEENLRLDLAHETEIVEVKDIVLLNRLASFRRFRGLAFLKSILKRKGDKKPPKEERTGDSDFLAAADELQYRNLRKTIKK